MATAKQLTDKELYAIRMARWRARTDLGYLCREILNYKDVDEDVHGPVLNILQKFPEPNKEEFYKNDEWDGKTWRYTPLRQMQELPEGRRRLILDPRSHLKTTINVQAHTIQWILNYPDLTLAIWQSNTEKAELILKEVRDHFRYNPIFRKLFPEHVPQKRIDDFGTKGEFTTMARTRSVVRRESTVMTLAIDKGTAGLHFDVMKFSDIVEPENVKNKERIQSVKSAFYMAENLLVSPHYWMDVEGTRYVFGDLYGDLIDQWLQEEAAGKPHEYRVHVRSVYKRLENGQVQTRFTPDTLDDKKYPFMKDADEKYIPWWTVDSKGQPRFSFDLLENERLKDGYIYSCQRLNSPKGGIEGREVFPETLILRIRRDLFRSKIRLSHITVTIDTAETRGQRSNYSAIVVVGWDWAGRAWVIDVIHGKFLPDELIKKIFHVYKTYRPSTIKIEETSFVRGLVAGLQREMDINGIYLPLEMLKRENQESKTERIQNTLQPWFTDGLLRFVDPPGEMDDPNYKDQWAALMHLFLEMKTFPIGKSDDILDALADQFQGKEWFGREKARPQEFIEAENEYAGFMEQPDPFGPGGSWNPLNPEGHNSFWDRTGGL